MGVLLDSLPQNTVASQQAQRDYNAGVLDIVQRGKHDPIEWAYVVIGRVKLAVFARPMTIESTYLGAGAYLLQQLADVLGCSLLTPRVQDAMYAQAATRILPWLDYDPRMATMQWFKRSTAGLNGLLQKAGYAGGLAMGMGKPFQLDNDLLHYPGRSENYGLYVPASACPGGKYLGVGTEACVSLPSNQVRVIQGRGWAHDLSQSDYSELISLVNRNCEVLQEDGVTWKLRDLVEVLQDPTLAPFVSHNGALKIVRQPGVPIAVRRGSVGGNIYQQAVNMLDGGPGDGRDGKTAAPFELTGLPPAGSAPAPGPLPAPVTQKFLEEDMTGTYVAAGALVALAGAAGYGLWRMHKKRKRAA